jgi:4'-phosphopantetheinyl transferase
MAADEIHVWCAALERPDAELGALAALLSDDERERAGRLREGPIRNEFVAARGLLRSILSRYRLLPPTAFRFRHGPTGKPHLDGVEPELFFNVSHSAGMALLALTGRGEVGVDVERPRDVKNHVGLARRYFLPQEADGLEALPPEASRRAFFRVWTAKEAILKAAGLGLANALERVQLTVEPDEPIRVVHFDGSEEEGRRWSLTHLTPDPDFLGAVAHLGHGSRLVCWRWPDPS